MKLWHDDVRPAPDGWVHARNNDEAKQILINNHVEEASFDHDLGYDGALPIKCDCDNGVVIHEFALEGNAFERCEKCDGDGFVGGDLMYVAGTSDDDGTKLAEWLAENKEYMPPIITIHSWNYAGADRMAKILRDAGGNVLVRPFKM